MSFHNFRSKRIYTRRRRESMDVLPGWKTYLAAAGLLGLALYQFSEGNAAGAWQSIMAALAAFGLRQAVARQK